MTTLLILILLTTYLLLISKKITALIRYFRYQALLLSLVTLFLGIEEKLISLYVISLFLLTIKVIIIPKLLYKIINKIKINDNVGFIINPQLSTIIGIFFTYLAWQLSVMIMPGKNIMQVMNLTICFTIILTGFFLMISRIKAITQTIGLLVIENGLFLLASSIAGGMPFLVEITICFDVLISVIILNVFLQKINTLFTHIDINRLTKLKG